MPRIITGSKTISAYYMTDDSHNVSILPELLLGTNSIFAGVIVLISFYLKYHSILILYQRESMKFRFWTELVKHADKKSHWFIAVVDIAIRNWFKGIKKLILSWFPIDYDVSLWMVSLWKQCNVDHPVAVGHKRRLKM